MPRSDAYAEAKARAREREFLASLDDVAPSIGMGLGLAPYKGKGQQGQITIYEDGTHNTVGAVHVAVDGEGKVVVAVEIGPKTELEVRPVVRRTPWRFRDYWSYDSAKHDNVLKHEAAWPPPPKVIDDV